MFLKKSHHHRHRHRHHRGYHYYALGCCYCVFARSSMNNVLLLIRLIDIEMSFYDPTLETGIRTRHYAEFDDGGGKYNLLVSYFFMSATIPPSLTQVSTGHVAVDVFVAPCSIWKTWRNLSLDHQLVYVSLQTTMPGFQ
jgi:hypothetical protein